MCVVLYSSVVTQCLLRWCVLCFTAVSSLSACWDDVCCTLRQCRHSVLAEMMCVVLVQPAATDYVQPDGGGAVQALRPPFHAVQFVDSDSGRAGVYIVCGLTDRTCSCSTIQVLSDLFFLAIMLSTSIRWRLLCHQGMQPQDALCLIQSVSNVRPSVHKKFVRFQWNLVCR